MLSRGTTFLGIDIVIAIWGATTALILSKMMTEVEVGLFHAASQLLLPVSLMNRSLVKSIFPSMCRKAVQGKAQLDVVTRWVMAFLLLTALPTLALFFVLAPDVLRLAYGTLEFERGVPVLRLAAITLACQCFTAILGHTLWAIHQERTTLRLAVLCFVCHVALSFVFIDRMGLVGAALSPLVVGWINVTLHALVFRRLVGQAPVDDQILVPIAATLVMAVVIWLTPYPSLIACGVGLLAYGAAALTLLALRYGGFNRLRHDYFSPLTG